MSKRRLRSPREALFALRVFAFAVVAPLLARIELGRLQSILEPRSLPPRADDAEVERVAARVDWVLRRGRPLVRQGCMTRGLTRFYFLRRAGADVKLAFGMGKPGDDFSGHCWLVRDGEPFLEKTDPRPIFTEIVSIPRS